MLSSVSRQTGPMRSRSTRTSEVCVVDSQAGDYASWDQLAQENGARLRIVGTAEEALRVARTTAIDLWVVNLDLPGLSGGELCGMLRGRSKAPVYLVADEYSTAAEQAAWQSRPTLFGCKGAHREWLDHWLKRRQANAYCESASSVSV